MPRLIVGDVIGEFSWASRHIASSRAERHWPFLAALLFAFLLLCLFQSRPLELCFHLRELFCFLLACFLFACWADYTY